MLADQPAARTLVANGDFNSDGLQDILWYNPSPSRMAVWLLRSEGVLERGAQIPAPAGGGWVAVAAGDFNGDGMADALWQQTTLNLLAVWLMRGTCSMEAGPAIPGPKGDGGVLTPYAGDANGDGLADIVRQNPAKNVLSVSGRCPEHGCSIVAPFRRPALRAHPRADPRPEVNVPPRARWC